MIEDKELRRELLRGFVSQSVLTHENITFFHSGEKGTDFFDLDNHSGYPAFQRDLLKGLNERIESLQDDGLSFDKLAFLDKDSGPAGMLPFAVQLSQELDKQFSIVKTWEKIRIDKLRVKGSPVTDGESILLIDDVLTTGSTQEKAIDYLENQGGDVEGLLVVLARYEHRLQNLTSNKDIPYEDFLFTHDMLKFGGLSLSEDAESYLSEGYIEEFEELYGIDENQLPDTEGIDEILEKLMEEHDMSMDDETFRAFKNLYFNAYLMVNQEELLGREEEKKKSAVR